MKLKKKGPTTAAMVEAFFKAPFLGQIDAFFKAPFLGQIDDFGSNECLPLLWLRHFLKAPFLGQIDDVGSNERTSKQLDLIT